MMLASEASQAEAAHQAAPRSSNGKPDAATGGRPSEARIFRPFVEQAQNAGEGETAVAVRWKSTRKQWREESHQVPSCSRTCLAPPTSTKESQEETHPWKPTETACRTDFPVQWMPLRQSQFYQLPQLDRPKSPDQTKSTFRPHRPSTQGQFRVQTNQMPWP